MMMRKIWLKGLHIQSLGERAVDLLTFQGRVCVCVCSISEYLSGNPI